jgi:sulfide:quinone oxidoreductase
MTKKRVIVIGGNFAGLTGALELVHLAPEKVDVTLISKSEQFLFTPSLIWLPFGTREPDDITFKIKPVLDFYGIRFVRGEATKIDPDLNQVCVGKAVFDYDYLLIATGPEANWEIVEGLGPVNGFSHNITTLGDAQKTGQAWRDLLNNPGPVVIGATQGATCLGAAYDFLFNFAHAVRKHRMTRQIPIQFVTPEPILGQFGLGSLKNGEGMLRFLFKKLGIEATVNASIKEITPDEVRIENSIPVPSKFSMIVPPFTGVKVVRETARISDPHGFIPTNAGYQHETYKRVFAAGMAVTVKSPWVTPVLIGAPKTGFPAEVMAKVAAQNIHKLINGKSPLEEQAFEAIPEVCVLDAGNMGVMIYSEQMLPPRGLEVLIPGSQSQWAKLAFEKYFLWKMKHGYVGLP